jgi:hypothetical protein
MSERNKKKYKYDIGDVVLLNNNNFGKVGIIMNKPESVGVVYNILVCGIQDSILFWEEEIDKKI